MWKTLIRAQPHQKPRKGHSSHTTLQDMATVPTVLATTVPWWPGRLGVWPHCDTAMLPVIRTP